MQNGPGRYLVQLFSELPIVRAFFAAALADPNRTGSLSLESFAQEQGYTLNERDNYDQAILSVVQRKSILRMRIMQTARMSGGVSARYLKAQHSYSMELHRQLRASTFVRLIQTSTSIQAI
jgi:hypothetical protein